MTSAPESTETSMRVWRGLKYPDSQLVSLVARYGGPREGPAVVIGCGNGRHVRLLSDLGFDAYGVEPDPEMAQTARDNGVEVIESGLESFEPGITPRLVVAWGLVMTMVRRDTEAHLARIGAPRQIIDWRTEENSYIGWDAQGASHFENGVCLTRIAKPGFLLDGRLYRSHTDQATYLPGYQRTHLQHVRVESEGLVHAWRQTVHERGH